MIRQYDCAWLVLLLAAVPLACWAKPPTQVARLETITILGTRTQQAPDQVPRSIDVIKHKRIAHRQSTDLGAIVDSLPNVSLDGSPRPLGETIRIRGLTGKRILLLIDGIRQDFSAGHVAGGFISPGLIESVAVERGPASVLWGSGAIGGVVSVDTSEAADLLAPGEALGARLHTGYQSASDAWITRAAVYGRLGDHVDALLQLGRQSHENLALGNGEVLSYSGYQRLSLLAKSTVHLASGNSLQVSHRRMRLESTSPTNPASTRGAIEDRELAVDASRVEWRWLPPTSTLLDLTIALSHIRTELDESQLGAAEHDVTTVESHGLDVTNTSRVELGAMGRHVLTYGIDANRDSFETSRNGHPRKLIPSGDRLIAGLFVQDVIHWNPAWTTTLGLRYDRYHSESDADGGLEHDDGELSVQAGVLWQASDWLQLYASYAEAFRAPSISELFTDALHRITVRGHLVGGFRIRPNPDLQPETAANKEIGLRSQWQGVFINHDRLQFELTVFRNDLENFIADKCIENCGSFRGGKPFPVRSFINVREARLEGFEAMVSYTTPAWFATVNYGQTRGYNETSDQPLGNIPADTWVVRAGFTALPWNGRVTWRMTHAEDQDRVPPPGRNPALDELPTDSYTVHALFTSWHPTPNLQLDLGVTNITDRNYRRHGTRIPEAGRSIKLSLTLNF